MQNPRPGRGAAAAQDILVAVPVELKSLVAPFAALVDAVRKRRQAARGGSSVDYATIEQEIAQRTAALECSAHASVLGSLEVDGRHVEIRGAQYARVGYGKGTYYTMTGPVEIERALYRQVGVRNAPVVDAISLRAGVVGRGWLPNTAQAMAHLLQQGTAREAEVTARQLGKLPYSRASFDRVAHEVGEQWLGHHADIEDELIQKLEIPSETRAISAALDRVSIPIEEPAKRPVGRPRKDAPARPITRAFRMAFVGTVTLHDAEGGSLYTIRYGCMPQSDPEHLCAEMANDVYRILERRPGLPLVLLADGAPEMWNLLDTNFPPEVFTVRRQLVDVWHLLEKLAAAARIACGAEGAKPAVQRWKAELYRSNSAAQTILAELQASGCEHVQVGEDQPVHAAITYLENHLDRFTYATARREHLPIGSGNVEATCKTLVGVRMKRSGARWKAETGEHILRLRALALSDRWEPAMTALHGKRRTAVRRVA